ncbi:hypothetical protein [Rhodoluna sp.]|uniref:hypothetical protein n=1 Tax=Rhodoluna sp. TaxID=1969481 RepID=UPI0025D94BB9|nr:hypothetical protein [Rhodoluna sp.]
MAAGVLVSAGAGVAEAVGVVSAGVLVVELEGELLGELELEADDEGDADALGSVAAGVSPVAVFVAGAAAPKPVSAARPTW